MTMGDMDAETATEFVAGRKMQEETAPLAEARPRATVLISIFNNAAFVPALLHSLLTQWRNEFELLVVDNGSTDGSLDAVTVVLADAPEITATVLRLSGPLGLGALHDIVRQANAPIIIQADSDDIMVQGRIDAILRCFDDDPRCRLVTTNAIMLSENGIPVGLYDIEHNSEISDDPAEAASAVGAKTWLGATSAYHRSLIEQFPRIEGDLCPYGLDLLLPFRATLVGTHHYLAEPLVGWRQHLRNTHKLRGAGSGEDEALERHGALELMVLAQKIRDLQYVQSESKDVSAAAIACQRTFMRSFEHWSRTRNRLAAGPRLEKPLASPPTLAAVPPITTLHDAARRYFGKVETLGYAVQNWDGVHAVEDAWNWTGRVAVLTFGWAGAPADLLLLGLRSSGSVQARTLRLSVNLGPYVDYVVPEAGTMITFAIEHRRQRSGLLTLVLHVTDASSPAASGQSLDDRMLGVQLLFIEARRSK